MVINAKIKFDIKDLNIWFGSVHALKQVNNGERYLQELQQAGYATDPNYANKIMTIYRNNLVGFDPSSMVALH